MEANGSLSISMGSVVYDILQKHRKRCNPIDLASRRAQEAASRRHEAAEWLRKTVGLAGTKDLHAEPSSEVFRLGLRNGIILCNSLNKVQPGAVAKVVEAPLDIDGAALSAYQHFENIENFLVAMYEMGIPSFEASDLEEGGNGARVVNCVLALKSFSEWKQAGGSGSWKYGGNVKPSMSSSLTRSLARMNSEPFAHSRTLSNKSLDEFFIEHNGELSKDSSEMNSSSLDALVRSILADKKPEEIPMLVESMLSNVIEEFERRLASQNEVEPAKDTAVSDSDGANFLSNLTSVDEMKDDLNLKMGKEDEDVAQPKGEGPFHVDSNTDDDDDLKHHLQKQQMLIELEERDIQKLKHTLHATKMDIESMRMKYSEDFSNLGKHLQSITQAASGYHSVLEENRKLYNQVQDLKGGIRVYCRVRPFLNGHPNSLSIVEKIEDGNITISTQLKGGKEGQKSFKFNKVFGPSATQEEVFADTEPLIRSVLDGYNVCIFAYGQTGTGKTYTMSGPKVLTEQSQGVNYRALNDLFHLSNERKGSFCYEISVQMLEIYNEQVRDLLASDGLNKRLEIRNNSQNGLNVPDANLLPVSSTSDVIKFMDIGQKNRAVSATAMNDRSSRSHSCLTVHVIGRDVVSGSTLRGCLHLVDLAGSERVDKSEVTGGRLKEAQHINKSLAALGDVISSLAQKNSHVPYRNSKLTQLLQDSLGGQAKTLMFVHISPEVDATVETMSTLKFAERVSTIELGVARANKESGEVKELKEQIASLKEALATKEEELENLQSSMSSAVVRKIKSGELSPIYPGQRSTDYSSDQSSNRHSSENLGNKERLNLDLNELVMAGDLQVHVEDRGELDWVDNVMVNKQEETHREKQHNEQRSRRGYESTTTTDDSDNTDMGTSDCSEIETNGRRNLPKVTSAGSGARPKMKKPQTKPAKSPELRSPSSSSSSKRMNNGNQPLSRDGKPPSADGKRYFSNRKAAGGK